MKKKKELLKKVVTFHNLYCLKKCIINWKIHVLLQKQKEIEENKINEVIFVNNFKFRRINFMQQKFYEHS